PWRFTDKETIAFAKSLTVPVIEDGGTVVADSWNIAIYLDQAYPQRPGLMDGATTVALTEFFNNWAPRTLHASLFPVIILDLFARLHEKDKVYFRASREKRFGTTLEAYGADPKGALAALREALAPARQALVQYPFLGGHGPGYADYILFGAFQWARVMSPIRLLEPDDPVFAWRERVLDLFGGFARQAKGFPVWA
ncbi:MAG TPA: glutathione S-transferase C-terminal domain-containing protein, partial [Burkholderiales bacterium]